MRTLLAVNSSFFFFSVGQRWEFLKPPTRSVFNATPMAVYCKKCPCIAFPTGLAVEQSERSTETIQRMARLKL